MDTEGVLCTVDAQIHERLYAVRTNTVDAAQLGRVLGLLGSYEMLEVTARQQAAD